MNIKIRRTSLSTLIRLQALRNLVDDLLTAVSFATVTLLLITALVTSILINIGVIPQDIYAGIDLSKRLQQPSLEHPFGTDHLGRDILIRIIFGTRVVVYVISVAVAISILIGTSIGLVAGYLGGSVDVVVSRVIDAIMCFPAVLLALSIVTILGPGIENVVIAIGIAESPVFARLARGLVIVEKEKLYVEAARAIGAGRTRILLKHIFPNIAGSILVQATFTASSAILWEAALSFLGLGTQPPTPSWGLMLYEAKDYMRIAPHAVIFPGLAIFFLVLNINILGEKLRDLIDPRYRALMTRFR
ncbi:MAG: ABC transporter permease [Ignisphaera sp.]